MKVVCELLAGPDSRDPHTAAALQLLPAVAVSGYGLNVQAFRAMQAVHGSPLDVLQALQRTDVHVSRVSVRAFPAQAFLRV